MKRILIILSALIVSAVTTYAQDLITKKSGEDIKAKVLEVDNNNVKYKLFDELDGVTYTMSKSQILMIRYESGRNEVFNTVSNSNYGYVPGNRVPIEDIRSGMKYKDLKHIYNYEDWRSELGDKHNPALMGLCSWIIPGLGQMISGEVGRGFGWLGGTVGCSIIMGIGTAVSAGAYDGDYYSEEDAMAGAIITLAGSLALLTVDICAIVDACRVAKVRNMYEQDLKRLNYSFELHPSVDYIKTANGVHPTAGVTLAMRF